jgi:glycosyltransferase involved in cell wall biosynthesis
MNAPRFDRCRASNVHGAKRRLAFVVSHPIQYTVPLYQRLARRDDIAIKVFFTWHAGDTPVHDRGFGRAIAWDIPLTEGYQFERMRNVAAAPRADRFFGLRNPDLLGRVLAWQPDVVHVTGWAALSHLSLLRALRRRGVPTLFFGDSHLIDGERAPLRRRLKAAVLRKVYSWPNGFLTVGAANRSYFESFGVSPNRLYPCPHSIDVRRYSEPAQELERQAASWRAELGIDPAQKVLLFAGKFGPKKRPLEVMRSVLQLRNRSTVLLLVGGGELQSEIELLAAAAPAPFRILPFQNQSRMPVVYRLGDVFVLPSVRGESWGLAVNEALASARPVIVSDRVGCAADLVNGVFARKFAWNDWQEFGRVVEDLVEDSAALTAMRGSAAEFAWRFDTAVMESNVVAAVQAVCSVRQDVDGAMPSVTALRGKASVQ